jgi:glycerol-3-phosphate dehydrogenase (NAD(P)+)
VSVAKGIENGTLLTTTQVLHQVLKRVPHSQLGILSGPSHAEEVAEGKPTTVVAAAFSSEVVHEIQSTFMTSRLRVYMNHDVLGVEIAGSVKNIMAIGAGIGDGLGYGDNTKAAIVTRGLAEIKRLGLAMGAESSTFSGLAGIGDLVVTCWSRHSRNRYLGEQIGAGRRLDDIERDMRMVAEGVRTTDSVYNLASKYRIEMPITEAVHQILFEGKKPQIAVDDLMSRSAKREDWLPDVLQD